MPVVLLLGLLVMVLLLGREPNGAQIRNQFSTLPFHAGSSNTNILCGLLKVLLQQRRVERPRKVNVGLRRWCSTARRNGRRRVTG